MYKKSILSILILVLMFSCYEQRESLNNESTGSIISFEEYPSIEHLSAEVIETPPKLFQPISMDMSDEILLIMDVNKPGGYFFQAFSIPDLSYAGEFIRKGGGPNEEYEIGPQYFVHTGKNNFMYSNIATIRTVNFSVKNNSIQLVDQVQLPEDLIGLSRFFKLDNKYYGYLSMQSKKEFFEFDPVTKKNSYFGADFPNVGAELTGDQKSMLFQRLMAVKPGDSSFAVVYHDFPFMRIYNKNGNVLTETRFENNQISPTKLVLKENVSEKDITSITINYRDLKVTNTYIYALYSGEKNRPLVPHTDAGMIDLSKEIHVWDWSGKPIAKLNLDHTCTSFAVSSDDTFIVTSSLKEFDKIFKYDLKDVF